jgi:hypothetical protein
MPSRDVERSFLEFRQQKGREEEFCCNGLISMPSFALGSLISKPGLSQRTLGQTEHVISNLVWAVIFDPGTSSALPESRLIQDHESLSTVIPLCTSVLRNRFNQPPQASPPPICMNPPLPQLNNHKNKTRFHLSPSQTLRTFHSPFKFGTFYSISILPSPLSPVP